jgi:hypothetical protein
VWPPGTGPGEKPVGVRAGDRPPSAAELCKRCGGHHEAAVCPTLDPESAPRRGPGGPVSWAAPRSNPAPEVAKAGRAAVDAATAAGRAARGVAAPEPVRSFKDLDEAAKRAIAARQATAGRAARERAAPVAPPPEDDLEQPPF